MKNTGFALLLLIASTSSHVCAQTIHADLEIVTPQTITDEFNVLADFHIPGSRIDIVDLQLIVYFTGNLFTAGERYTIDQLVDVENPPAGVTSPAWVRSSGTTLGDPQSQHTYLMDNLHIDENGYGYFSLKYSGDGVTIGDISLTGNAIITPVPIPPALILFASGLFILFRPLLLRMRSCVTHTTLRFVRAPHLSR